MVPPSLPTSGNCPIVIGKLNQEASLTKQSGDELFRRAPVQKRPCRLEAYLLMVEYLLRRPGHEVSARAQRVEEFFVKGGFSLRPEVNDDVAAEYDVEP